ncbi:hypothetical protein Rrhod_2154 [Rhodococcus rhodnii LMG 5362]|uniref:Uncharacterized protein n=1 Tax=Rhodococcus rhodnii LMG 5362 TaxID=1273125 RepID=R7WR71_9NOCA|nr:hypothetical protein Rrhod_2154 [Rhodococcus rhodnii LMG 5362]
MNRRQPAQPPNLHQKRPGVQKGVQNTPRSDRMRPLGCSSAARDHIEVTCIE